MPSPDPTKVRAVAAQTVRELEAEPIPPAEMAREAERLGLTYGRVYARDTTRAAFLYSFPMDRCDGTTISVPIHGTAADLTREHDATVAKWAAFETRKA